MPTPVHLSIPEPCHEGWLNMTPNEKGRHCLSCQKTVVDFSVMSDQEILHYISSAGSRVCGRFTPDQLDKVYAVQKPAPFSWKYAFRMMVATFLFTGNATLAQSVAPPKEETLAGKRDSTEPIRVTLGMVVRMPEIPVTGIVTDGKTKAPVAYAYILIKGTKTGIVTREDGSFSIQVPAGRNKMTLVVSSVGYEVRELEVSLQKKRNLNIALSENVNALEGEVMIVKKVSVAQKVKREIKSWLPKQDLSIYPNPVVPGSGLTVTMNLKKTGHYKMELLDVSGRVMYIQELQVNQSSQVAHIPTQVSWAGGIYWLRLSNGTKNVYQAKVMVQ
jgi:hypothetical protein